MNEDGKGSKAVIELSEKEEERLVYKITDKVKKSFQGLTGVVLGILAVVLALLTLVVAPSYIENTIDGFMVGKADEVISDVADSLFSKLDIELGDIVEKAQHDIKEKTDIVDKQTDEIIAKSAEYKDKYKSARADLISIQGKVKLLQEEVEELRSAAVKNSSKLYDEPQRQKGKGNGNGNGEVFSHGWIYLAQGGKNGNRRYKVLDVKRRIPKAGDRIEITRQTIVRQQPTVKGRSWPIIYKLEAGIKASVTETRDVKDRGKHTETWGFVQ